MTNWEKLKASYEYNKSGLKLVAFLIIGRAICVQLGLTFDFPFIP